MNWQSEWQTGDSKNDSDLATRTIACGCVEVCRVTWLSAEPWWLLATRFGWRRVATLGACATGGIGALGDDSKRKRGHREAKREERWGTCSPMAVNRRRSKLETRRGDAVIHALEKRSGEEVGVGELRAASWCHFIGGGDGVAMKRSECAINGGNKLTVWRRCVHDAVADFAMLWLCWEAVVSVNGVAAMP